MKRPPEWLALGYFILFALLPWSLDIDFGAWNLSLPSEPLIAALAIGLSYCCWKTPGVFLSIFSNNIFLKISFAYIVWMAVSACFSSLPIVSWKYWLVSAAHWWVFAVGFSVMPGLWRRAFPWFAFSMAGVAVYTLVHHGFYDFRADQALLAPRPFFPDHTMWAAAVVMVLCLGIVSLGRSSTESADENKRFYPLFGGRWKTVVFFVLLLSALVLSTCRAAWVSVVFAGLVWTLLVLGNNVRVILLLSLFAGGILMGEKIVHALRQDVSSMERINRWNCALRMTQEKPLLGFGLGTFQFQYLDFQKNEEMTRISIRKDSPNSDVYGHGGGAHSEYLRALSETGWPGWVLWLGIVLAVLVQGTKIFKKPSEILHAQWHLKQSAMLALLTFFAHGIVNDFIHDGRVAALVWGSMALLFAESDEK